MINIYLLGKILSEFQILFLREVPRSRIALSSGVNSGSPLLLAVKLLSCRAGPAHQHRRCWRAVRLPPHSTAADFVVLTSNKRELGWNTFWPALMWSQTESDHFDFFCLTNPFFFSLLAIFCKTFISSRKVNLNVRLERYEVNNSLSGTGLLNAVCSSRGVYNS